MMDGTVPIDAFIRAYVAETAEGDYVLVSAENPSIRFLLMPLAENVPLEGAVLLPQRIRERFKGCFEDYGDGPGGGGRRRRPQKAAANRAA